MNILKQRKEETKKVKQLILDNDIFYFKKYILDNDISILIKTRSFDPFKISFTEGNYNIYCALLKNDFINECEKNKGILNNLYYYYIMYDQTDERKIDINQKTIINYLFNKYNLLNLLNESNFILHDRESFKKYIMSKQMDNKLSGF
jgi:hypothetical protein